MILNVSYQIYIFSNLIVFVGGASIVNIFALVASSLNRLQELEKKSSLEFLETESPKMKACHLKCVYSLRSA